jgi:hypothetical protein
LRYGLFFYQFSAGETPSDLVFFYPNNVNDFDLFNSDYFSWSRRVPDIVFEGAYCAAHGTFVQIFPDSMPRGEPFFFQYLENALSRDVELFAYL